MLPCEARHRHLELRAACNTELTKEKKVSRFLASLTSLFSGVTNSSAALCTVNWSGRTHCSPPLSLGTACSRNAASFSFPGTALVTYWQMAFSCTGSWTVQLEKGGTVVVLRSLLRLGLMFYHVPMTERYGYVCFGTGEKNLDLPFMLWLACLGWGLENI